MIVMITKIILLITILKMMKIKIKMIMKCYPDVSCQLHFKYEDMPFATCYCNTSQVKCVHGLSTDAH